MADELDRTLAHTDDTARLAPDTEEAGDTTRLTAAEERTGDTTRITGADDTTQLTDADEGAGDTARITAAEQPSPSSPADAMPAATVELPQATEAPGHEEQGQQDPSPAPSFGEVSTALASWAKARARAAGAFLSGHRLLVGLVALACVAAILGAVLLGIDSAQTPPDSLIKSDANARLGVPTHTASDYELDEPLVLQSVEIEHKGTSGARGDACDVDIVATFANSGMETRADAQLTYLREGESWSCTAASVNNASHHATAGVSHKRVLEHLDKLLDAANVDGATVSLSSLYRNAAVEVVGENFIEDAQTDALILHLKSQGTFVSYECDLTVHFRFVPASGAWELVEAVVSDGAYDLGFGPLVGTWQGTFTQQEASSNKCLAAKEAGLTVKIEKAAMREDGDAVVEGTLTGIAHLHPEPVENVDFSSDDELLEEIPFAGHISTGDVEQDVIGLLAGNNPKRDVAGIVFDCTTQELTHGAVTLTLTFGTSSAPDSAFATLTSTYSYQDLFLMLVPYQRDARFADSFTLEKVDGE